MANNTGPAPDGGTIDSLLNSVLGGKSDSLNRIVGTSFPIRLTQSFLSKWQHINFPAWTVAIAILGTLPATFTHIRSVALNVYWWVAKYFISSVTVAGNDRLNKDVINWVARNVLPARSIRTMTARTEVVHTDYWSRRLPFERDDVRHEKRVPVQYLPAFGTTWFVHDRNVFLVSRMPPEMDRSGGSWGFFPIELAAAPEGHEHIVVMCLGRSVGPIKRFLDVCRNFSEEQNREYVTVRTSKKHSYSADECWGSVALRPRRALETVHFDEAVKAELVEDIHHYLEPATRRFYVSRGIPYRRGYLLHGPPGTGKTSLSLALAGLFELDLYLCHIPSVKDDGELENQFANLPPKCIILLEDIDTVGVQRRGLDSDSDSDDSDADSKHSRRKSSRYNYRSRAGGCSLAGLLNVLDGVASQEGRIVLMTSNFADKLDRALVRPGRIDQMIYLGNISRTSSEKMFKRMYSTSANTTSTASTTSTSTTASAAAAAATPDAKGSTAADVKAPRDLERLAAEFGGLLPGEEVFTPAQLQGYLLGHRGDPHAAVEEVGDWAAEEIRVAEAMAEGDRVRAERRAKRRRIRKAAKAAAAREEARLAEGKGKVGEVEDEGSKEVEEGQKARENEGVKEKAGGDGEEKEKEKAMENGEEKGEKGKENGHRQENGDEVVAGGEVNGGGGG